MEIIEVITFGFALAAMAFKPGPNVFASITFGLSGKFTNALFFIVGVCFAQTTYMLFAFAGIDISAEGLKTFTLIFKLAGVALLVWFGIKSLLNLKSGAWEGKTSIKPSYLQNFTSGLLLTLGNVIVIFFYATVFPAIFGVIEFSILNLVVLTATIFFFTGGTLSAYALMAKKMKSLLSKPKSVRLINLISAIVYFLLAIAVMLSAFPAFAFEKIYF